MLRFFAVAITLGACTTQPSVECLYPTDCASGICTNNRCVRDDAGRDSGPTADAARDVVRADAPFDAAVDDGGGCVGCEADEGCFRGRCVRCTGSVLADGCACSESTECRTGLCDADRCTACRTGADCEEGDCNAEGVCFACGGDGEACCEDGMPCTDETQACTADGVCGVCGAIGEACCATGCDEGAACADGLCAACGGLGQPACAGDMPCNGMLGVIDGLCQQCGGVLQFCCTEEPMCRLEGAMCNSGRCIGGRG